MARAGHGGQGDTLQNPQQGSWHDCAPVSPNPATGKGEQRRQAFAPGPQQNGSGAGQGAEQQGQSTGLATGCCLQVTVSAAGDVETGRAGPGGEPPPVTRPGVPAPSQVFMRVPRTLRLPGGARGEGLGERGLHPTPQMRSRGPTERPGRLGSCPGPPAPLTSRPRPPPGLEPSRPRPNSDDTSGKVNAVWKHSAIPKGSGGKRSRGAATMLAAPGSAPGCAPPPAMRPWASCLPLWGSPAPV